MQSPPFVFDGKTEKELGVGSQESGVAEETPDGVSLIFDCMREWKYP